MQKLDLYGEMGIWKFSDLFFNGEKAPDNRTFLI